MKRISLLLVIMLPLLLSAQTAISVKIDGTISPVTESFIRRIIEKANNERAECVVIQLNTPGGLLKSTRVIVTDIMESPVPVIVFVYPSGAHAGSAGLFITLAAHVAAMAPGTNLGAAHPVLLQGTQDSVMNDKSTNDAAAFIRTIAEKRKRNMEWAEEAVRSSVSITESEALKENVIDLVASNTRELLDKIDGKIVDVASRQKMLRTKSVFIKEEGMGYGERALDLLGDPNIAYILFLLGLYGLLFELYNPGAILPGIVGGIALILAFYAMHTLPVNWAGVALIVFAVILFLLELKLASHGILAIGGIVSLFLGSMMLFRTGSNVEFVNISMSVIIGSVIATSLFFLLVIGLGIKAQRAKPTTGVEGMIGLIGESLEALTPTGIVRIHGERWLAESVGGNISKGESVRVKRVSSLKLYVEPINNS
jgi:membrane-bound serine protease (ClpP class)